jgi:hypothetical protein
VWKIVRVKLEAAHRLLDPTQFPAITNATSSPKNMLILAEEALDLIADIRDKFDSFSPPGNLEAIVTEGVDMAKDMASKAS